jgi:type I restriction enzyme S subunit
MVETKNTKPFYNNEIPIDWQAIDLEELGVFSKGKGILKDQLISEGIPCIRYGEIYTTHNYVINEFKSFIGKDVANDSKEIKAGDILFAGSGETIEEIGKSVAYLGKEIAYAGGDVIILSTTSEVNALYLSYTLETDFARKQKRKLGQGNSVVHIYSRDLKKVKIPLPLLPEQKAIASLLSKWDEAIHKNQQLITQKEKRKKWLMKHLLTGKKRLKGFENTKWHLKSLEEVAEFKNGKAHENIIYENGSYTVVNSKFISTEGAVFKCSNENLCPLFINDIVMVMSDIPNGKALAKCFYVNENNKYTLNQRICSIKAFGETDSHFLFFILNRNSHYLSFNNGVGQTNLRKEEVLECPLMMPPKEEQTAIAQVLQVADREIQLLKTKADKLKEQKKGLMQVLLTGKKRLNLNLQD